MNPSLSGPPLRLLAVPSGLWDRPSRTADATLAELAQSVAETARKLAKGLQASAAHTQLMALSQRISAWVEEFGDRLAPWDVPPGELVAWRLKQYGPLLRIMAWDVPPGELVAWRELLAALAHQNAARAAARYQKPSAPLFLPMAFPPAELPGDKESYGWISVPAHCQALRELVVEGDKLAAVRAQRLARFDAAREGGLGLVEVVQCSLPGESPEGWT